MEQKEKWTCLCGATLGLMRSDNVVEILGQGGQAYEIGFNYIDAECNKCGKEHTRFSSAWIEGVESVFAGAKKSQWHVPRQYQDRLLQILSEKQREVYKLLHNGVRREDIPTRTNLPANKAEEHIKKIEVAIADITNEREQKNHLEDM